MTNFTLRLFVIQELQLKSLFGPTCDYWLYQVLPTRVPTISTTYFGSILIQSYNFYFHLLSQFLLHKFSNTHTCSYVHTPENSLIEMGQAHLKISLSSEQQNKARNKWGVTSFSNYPFDHHQTLFRRYSFDSLITQSHNNLRHAGLKTIFGTQASKILSA